MAERIMNIRISLLNKTTEEWAEDTNIPFKGCPCVEFSPDGKTKLKIGDGVNLYSALPYVADELSASLIISALGFTPIDGAREGIADGIATLDSAGKVPTSQLPSYVDDVVEVEGIDNAPMIGEKDKIYVDTITNKTYRWSGTSYVSIAASDIVTASELNGYIKINGTDVKVYEPIQPDWDETDETSPAFIKNKPIIPQGVAIDGELSLVSENAVQNKVIAAALADKIDESDSLYLNCAL